MKIGKPGIHTQFGLLNVTLTAEIFLCNTANCLILPWRVSHGFIKMLLSTLAELLMVAVLLAAITGMGEYSGSH